MSNNELGMLLVMVLCLVFTMTVIFIADKRIEEAKKSKNIFKDVYQRTYHRLVTQKILNVQLEKELLEAKETALAYEKILLDTEDDAIATADYYEDETERNIEDVPITDIATELCKRSDVVHFLIDVKNDTQKYSLSGGGC